MSVFKCVGWPVYVQFIVLVRILRLVLYEYYAGYYCIRTTKPPVISDAVVEVARPYLTVMGVE